jgi:membrane protease YdiL (CAAX protease family)
MVVPSNVEGSSQGDSGPIIGLVFLPSIVVAGIGLGLLALFRSRATSDLEAIEQWHRSYYLFLPATLLLLFPLLLRGLRRRGIVLGQQWASPSTLAGDLAAGALAAICGLFAAVVYVKVTHLALPHPSHVPPALWRMAVLVVLAPPIKEIAFRLYPLLLLEPRLGPLPAYLIGTVAFAFVDWQNLGASFVAGTVWYLFYRWRRRLIVPTVAHALANLIAIGLG